MAAGGSVWLSGSCPAGGLLQADLRPVGGVLAVRPTGTGAPGAATGDSVRRQWTPAADEVLAPMTLPTSTDGRFDLEITAEDAEQRLAPDRFACYDTVRASRLVAQARSQAPGLTVRGGHLEATWPRPVAGEVIVSTTARDQWSCSVDGRPARIGARQGLLEVGVDGATRLSCRYRTPGLGSGIALAATSAALVVMIGIRGRPAARRRRGFDRVR